MSTVFSNSFTRIYADFILRENLTKKDIQQFKQAIYEEIVFLNDFGNFELAEHHCGMSLVELAHIVTDERVSKIINVDLESAASSAQVEKILNNANAELTKLISTRGALKDNILQVYQEAEALNYAQISQVLIAFGPRSEINDKVYGRPVYGSSLSGMRDIIDEVRNNLPDEIRESKKIVNDREQIMQNARIESESIIQQAEERARVLTSEQEIVKRSQQHAAEILSAAQKSAKELTRKATLYCETILKNSEEVLGRSMADIKNTRMNLRSAARPKNNMPK